MPRCGDACLHLTRTSTLAGACSSRALRANCCLAAEQPACCPTSRCAVFNAATPVFCCPLPPPAADLLISLAGPLTHLPQFAVWLGILFPVYHAAYGSWAISLGIPPPSEHFGLAVVAGACQVRPRWVWHARVLVAICRSQEPGHVLRHSRSAAMHSYGLCQPAALEDSARLDSQAAAPS